nr:helix-turn-helix transcriptional regulator [Rhodanobacter spathiphylli]
MNKSKSVENPPMGHQEQFLRIERADGPGLIAFVVKDLAPERESVWHRHLRGQFMYVESGLVCVRTRLGLWTLTPHRVGWMPPGEEHTVSVIQSTQGWGVFVAPQAAVGMPDEPSVLGANELMRALVHRASAWADSDRLDDGQQRIMDVLMDEMRRARIADHPLHLPMPDDRRLLRISRKLLAEPHDNRSLEAWADWAGLSARSLSRLFRSETGCSFAQWRQQARLSRALERLAAGEQVGEVADALGYVSVSAFVAMFRRQFGRPPARYFAQRSAPV